MTVSRRKILKTLIAVAGCAALSGACSLPPPNPGGATPVPQGYMWVNDVTPSSTPYNTSARVKIRGGGYQPGATVTIGGQATDVVFIDSGTIMATTPSLDAGVADVVVTNPDGNQNASRARFTWQDLKLSWVSSPAAFPLDEIAISGTGFKPGAQVLIDGQSTGPLTLNSAATGASIVVPDHGPGAVSFVLVNPDGRSVALPSFTYLAASLSVSATTVDPGGAISVSWIVPAGQEGTISLYRVGAPETAQLWKHEQTEPTGKVELTAPLEPGAYHFRYVVYFDWDHWVTKIGGGFVVNSAAGR